MAKPPEIVMVSTYRPPVPKEFRRRPRRWPKRLIYFVIFLLLAAGSGVAGLEAWLGRDPRLPRIERRGDYRPKVITEVHAASGEIIGESVGERRRPSPAIPPALSKAVVERVEPTFFQRARLGQTAFVGALWRWARGRPDPPSLTRSLAHRLAEIPEADRFRSLKEWLLAIRLDGSLARNEILEIYLAQVPFGAGRFGAEEGARAHFGVSVGQLNEKQLGELAALADSEGPTAPPPAYPAAPEYSAAVVHELASRFDPEELARLGALIGSGCDLELTRAIRTAVRRQKLEAEKLSATVIVQSAESHEVRALVGPALDSRRPAGSLRAPLVLAAALQSLKFHVASAVAGQRLRSLALTNPAKAAEALLAAGLSEHAVQEISANLGVTGKEASPRDWSSAFTSLASLGVRRQAQWVRTVDGQPESESRHAPFTGVSPETAWLVNSLFPLGKAAGFAARDPADAWFVAWTAGAEILVRVGFDDGRPLGTGAAAERAGSAASAIGRELLRLLPGGSFPRPPALVSRRLDPAGQVQPSTATSGTEEWFLPGSLPRENPVLPPE